ncbi:MAG TPA: tubulin-like doman-containing protein [Anaerolineaceae bacterium]
MIKLPQTIVIGLGKWGKAALEQFKARILQTYEELPSIQLLAVDVPPPGGMVLGGAAAEAPVEMLGPAEMLELPLDEVLASGPDRILEMFPWLPEDFGEGDQAWYQSRAAQRLALHVNFPDIIRRLENTINQIGTIQARDEMAKKGFEVSSDRNEAALIVLAGLGEESGSALILDFTYLIHYLFRKASLQVASMGILCLPPAVPADPAAESCAYAALKELNSFMEGKTFRCDLPGTPMEFSDPPFNNGCYLVDTRNERNINLRDQDEVALVAAEWLFRMWFSPLNGALREFGSEHGAMKVQDRFDGYSSFGLATYIIPKDALVEWFACNLGQELISGNILSPGLFANVAQRLSDFFSTEQLRPDDLIDKRLRLEKDGRTAMQLRNQNVSNLKSVPHDQLIGAVNNTLESIRRSLPGFKEQIKANAKMVVQNVDEVIRQQVTDILERNPRSGLSLAVQFTTSLRDQAVQYSEVLARRATAYQAFNHHQQNLLSRLGEMLKNAAAGIPPLPIVFLAVIGALFTPLILTSNWVFTGLGWWSLLLLLLIWLFAMGGAVYAGYRAISGVNEVRDRYITHLNDRFEMELKQALVQEACGLYPEIIQVANAELDRLNEFSECLQRLSREYKIRLNKINLTGEMGFSLQRSVLTMDTVDKLYREYIGTGGAQAHLTPLVESVGAISKWRRKSIEEINAQLMTYARGVFKQVDDLRAEDLLVAQSPTLAQLEARVREFQDKAAPLWSPDTYSLGMTTSLADKFFYIAEGNATGDLRRRFGQATVSTAFETFVERHSLIISMVKRGMPLFGLKRMEQFRRGYLDTVRAGNRILHLEDELAVGQDLKPSTVLDMDAPTAFSLGCVLDFIRIRDDSVYTVKIKGVKNPYPLSNRRVYSVVLLENDHKLHQSLVEEINEKVASLGVKEVAELLETHLESGKVSGWEEARLKNYLAILQG